MSYPHGFKSKQKFENYLRCLNNIKKDSKLKCSTSNHVDGLLQIDCSVVLIENQFGYYGSGVASDIFNKLIILSFNGNQKVNYSYSLYGLGTKLSKTVCAKLGPNEALSGRYLVVNNNTLITKIDNTLK